MTKRIDVSALQNRWFDAQRVDQTDMEVEQDANNQIDAAIVNNHFGSGVLPSSPEQIVLFDSNKLDAKQAALLASHNFDGYGMQPHEQPSDINFGNQLEVELTESDVFGRLSVKVAIIGLSFDGTLQMDRFYFYKNEVQVTSKHYTKVLALFFNDFKGNNNCSRDLGGHITIKEASSFQLSKDPVMVTQDVEPDIFWRDFKLPNPQISLWQIIQNGIGPNYNVDALQINVTGQPSRELLPNDVTTQVGQKFKAATDNLQKATFLLGVRRDDGYSTPIENIFDWNGELLISIYGLQTSVKCPSDIVPQLAIDFDPDSVPLAQLSVTQETLRDLGYVLTDVLQPVDFVFSSTKLGSSDTSQITPGNFYTATLKRSGAATSGTVFMGTSTDKLSESRLTVFSGVWTDVPENDLWFQIWTDSGKIADGQGYDFGNGIIIPKITTDSETGAEIDNEDRHHSFVDTGEDILNIGLLQAVEKESVIVQNERTGNDVFSRKQFSPSFSFIKEAELEELNQTTEPLIIGCVQDTNPKQNPQLDKFQDLPGLAKGDTFCVVNPDPDLLSLNLLGSKIVPNVDCCLEDFRIFRVTFCTDGYGDVNGDGYIDKDDIALVSSLVGESLYYNSTQQKIIDGYFSTLEILRADVDGDGYITATDVGLITSYVNKVTNAFPVGSSFTHLCFQVQQSIGRYDGYFDCDGYVRLDGYTGQNIVDPSSLSPSELIYDGYISTPKIDLDPIFTTVPFPGVFYRIVPQPYWQSHLLALDTDIKLVPATFSYDESITPSSCEPGPTTSVCYDHNDVTPQCDPGRNDFFVPDNLIIGKGQIIRPDGTYFKHDFEVGTVILQLPAIPFEEQAINIFEKFVADRGDGFTDAGYPAMRYADCTTVQSEDILLNKLRFNVALQAFVPNLDGYVVDGYGDGYGIIVDDIIGVYMDYTTGILKLTIKDLEFNPIYRTMVSKIQIIVYLKKATWNNKVLFIEPSEVEGLISS